MSSLTLGRVLAWSSLLASLPAIAWGKPSDRTRDLLPVIVDRYGHARSGSSVDDVQEAREGDHLTIEVEFGDYYDLDPRWSVSDIAGDRMTLLNSVGADGLALPANHRVVYVWAPEGVPALQWWANGVPPSIPSTETQFVGEVTVDATAASQDSLDLDVDCNGTNVKIPITGLADGQWQSVRAEFPSGYVAQFVAGVLTVGVEGQTCTTVGSMKLTPDGGQPLDLTVKAVTETKLIDATATSCRRHELLTRVVSAKFPSLTAPAAVYACDVDGAAAGFRVLERDPGPLDQYKVIVEVKKMTKALPSVSVAVSGASGATKRTTRSETPQPLVGRVPLALSLLKGDLNLDLAVVESDGSTTREVASGLGVLPVGEASPPPPVVDVHVGLLVRDGLRTPLIAGMISPIYNPDSVLDWPRNFKGHSGWVHFPVPVAGIRLGADDDVLGLVMGGGISIVPGWKVVGGVEFGTGHISRPWRADRSWFVGITLSPVLFDKLVKAAASRAKSTSP